MKVDKREFARDFSQLSCPDQTRTRVTWKLTRVDMREFACMRVFSTLVSWSNENKSYMRVDESWHARVCTRVFSTLMSRSNENKSYMRVDESWEARSCVRVTQLSYPVQSRTRVTWQFAWEFSQLSCPVQTRTRVTWALASESLHKSYTTLVPRTNENKSWILSRT
jgi:hypothetical protein